jgi:GT2 family glycosyltransferase
MHYFITVNYNNTKVTLEYVQSILNLKGNKDCKIIIIDNNSEVNNFNNLKNKIESNNKITLIKNESNIGYFPGLNVGIRYIKNKKNSLLIIGNNDLKFKNDFLLKLDNINYNRNVYVIAPNVITLDGFHQNPHYLNKISTIKKIYFSLYFSNYYIAKLLGIISALRKNMYLMKRGYRYNYNNEIYIYQGIGACYILTENFFKIYRDLDDNVFLYGEEQLLANQVEKGNGKILYNPNVIVYHKEKASTSSISAKKAYKTGQKSYKIYSKLF